jgi:hypothetical protein
MKEGTVPVPPLTAPALYDRGIVPVQEVSYLLRSLRTGLKPRLNVQVFINQFSRAPKMLTIG